MTPTLSHALLLAVPSTVGLALLVAHGFTFRRWRPFLAFLLVGLVFGIVRGNVIYWITVDWYGRLSGAFGMMPYVMTTPVLRIVNASFQECVGWLFALGLGWCLSEAILERFGDGRRPVFAVAGLNFVFMAAICYAVEAGAGALGWWVWTIPIKNRLFVDVPPQGMWAWPSVAFCFFMPFLAIAAWSGPGRRRWWWLMALVFPLYVVLHVYDPFFTTRVIPWLQLSLIWQCGMLSAAVLLAVAVHRTGDVDREPPPGRWARAARWFPLAVAVMLLVDLWVGIGVVAARPDLLVATAPLLVFTLLAVRRVPLPVVAVVALACAPLAHWRGLAALAPLVFFGLLALGRRHAGSRRFVLATAAGLAALSVVIMLSDRWCLHATQAHAAAIVARAGGAGDAVVDDALDHAALCCDSMPVMHARTAEILAAEGQAELARAERALAVELDPTDVKARYELAFDLIKAQRYPDALEQLDVATSVLPSQPELHATRGSLNLLLGDRAAARASLQRALDLRPCYGTVLVNMTQLDATEGTFDHAIAMLDRAHAACEDPADRQRVQQTLEGVQQARTLATQGDYPAAQAALRAGLAAWSDDPSRMSVPVGR